MTVLKIFGIFVLVYVGLSLLPGGGRKIFLTVTTAETKTGLLLIDIMAARVRYLVAIS